MYEKFDALILADLDKQYREILKKLGGVAYIHSEICTVDIGWDVVQDEVVVSMNDAKDWLDFAHVDPMTPEQMTVRSAGPPRCAPRFLFSRQYNSKHVSLDRVFEEHKSDGRKQVVRSHREWPTCRRTGKTLDVMSELVDYDAGKDGTMTLRTTLMCRECEKDE